MYKKPIDFNTQDYSKLTTNQLKRMADYWQRQYLLEITIRNGRGQIYCPLKQRYFNEEDMHVAHFVDRHHLEYRYSEDNCHLVSKDSNMWDAKEDCEGYKSKHHYDYEMWLREKIGDKKVEEMLQVTNSFRIFARERYIEQIEKFRDGR